MKGPRRGGGGGFWGGVQPTRRPGFRLFAPNNNEGRDFPPAVSTKEMGRCATHTPPLLTPLSAVRGFPPAVLMMGRRVTYMPPWFPFISTFGVDNGVVCGYCHPH